MAALRRAGVAMHHGVTLRAFEGTAGVEAVRFVDRNGKETTLACDAVAFGFGLKPETQLAELAGVPLDYDPVFRQWLPRADTDGRCGDIYLAGDGATIGGAQAAALTGTLAACAVLEDHKIAVDRRRSGARTAPGRAAAPLPARTGARVRVAGRGDPPARRRRHGLPLRGDFRRRRCAPRSARTSARPR